MLFGWIRNCIFRKLHWHIINRKNKIHSWGDELQPIMLFLLMHDPNVLHDPAIKTRAFCPGPVQLWMAIILMLIESICNLTQKLVYRILVKKGLYMLGHRVLAFHSSPFRYFWIL
ncbi:hypothetical protein CK910_14425 [Aeromonas sp. CA23]|nr:hypothetical protein CK910_14425 [Aeromonas sp. CA23]